MAKLLNIVTSAYRGTIEEQDDTVLWLTHSLKGAGADVDVLLEGNAVNYVVRGQDASGLCFGDWRQTQPPRIEDDLAALRTKGARLFVVREDLGERGIASGELMAGIELVERAEVAALLEGYDRLWRW